MSKFRVYALFSATKYLGEFEAETADQAQNLADSLQGDDEDDRGWNSPRLCCQCADEVDLGDAPYEFIVEPVEN